MGEARRRGTYEQRKVTAIERNKGLRRVELIMGRPRPSSKPTMFAQLMAAAAVVRRRKS